MNEINLFPGRIEITNYELGDNTRLEKALSVWDKVNFKVSYNAYVYDEDNKVLIIPGGVSLDYLMKCFPSAKINYTNRNNVEKYRNVYFSLKYPTRETLQNKAINFMQKDLPQLMLSLATGKGKTYCAIHYSGKSKKLALTVVDQESIALQWIDKLTYFTNIKNEEIFLISGKDSINKLLKMKNKELNTYKWFIGIHRTFSNLIEEDPDEYTKLMKHLKIGLRYYDEAHVEWKNIFNMDRLYDCKSIYITATPNRGNPFENKVYQLMFSNQGVPRFVGSGDKYLNIIVYKYNSHPTDEEEYQLSNKYGFDTIAWSKYIMNDNLDLFTDILGEVLETVYKSNKHKTAILLKSIDLCNTVYDQMQSLLEEKGLTSGKYHSKIKNREKTLEKDVIFSTEKSFGKALDVKDLSVCINTVPCSSESTILQIMGRLREIPDKEVFFIDLFDEGFAKQKKQYTKRLTIYKNKSKKIYYIKK